MELVVSYGAYNYYKSVQNKFLCTDHSSEDDLRNIMVPL